MNNVIQNLGTFFTFALAAMFVQNTVFTRGLGVSRLVKLVGDSTVDTITFCALLCLIQVSSAPLAYLSNKYLLPRPEFWFREYIRPLVLVLCAVLAFGVVLVVLALVPIPNAKEMIAVLPMATFNTAVLGPMLISGVQQYDFVQTMGFALGSGLGYTLAVVIVTEGQRKLSSRNVPSIFKGLPINLLYIGILAMAIYGLTGHTLMGA